MYRGGTVLSVALAIFIVGSPCLPAYSQAGSRPGYIYDYAGIISDGYEAQTTVPQVDLTS